MQNGCFAQLHGRHSDNGATGRSPCWDWSRGLIDGHDGWRDKWTARTRRMGGNREWADSIYPSCSFLAGALWYVYSLPLSPYRGRRLGRGWILESSPESKLCLGSLGSDCEERIDETDRQAEGQAGGQEAKSFRATPPLTSGQPTSGGGTNRRTQRAGDQDQECAENEN